MNALVGEEMQLHIGICEGGRDYSGRALFATPERTENLAYTRFVLEAGYSGDLLDLLGRFGALRDGIWRDRRPVGVRGHLRDTYRDWINTYASDGYQTGCKAVGELLDSALTRRIGPDFRRHRVGIACARPSAQPPSWRSISGRWA